MIGIVAVAAGLYGAFVAGSSDRGEVVGIVDLELNLYAVNTTGGLVLAGIGILAVIAVLSRTPVPMWTASGIAGLMALYGLLAWRDDTGNSLGFDGRTISLLLGLCLQLRRAGVGWLPPISPWIGSGVDYTQIAYEVDGPIATITLDRPDQLDTGSPAR